MVCGWFIGRYIEPHCESRYVAELAIAFWIAGFLTITVDPFVKRRARREATRDIFHHMLGFKLPECIRTRLQEMVETTKLYREDVIQHIAMTEEGDFVRFLVEMEFEVINPTQHTRDFEPLVQFEPGERPELISVICFGDANYGQGAALSEAKGGLGALEYRGKGVPIPSDGRRRFKYEYAIKLPTSLGFWFLNFVLPTVGLSLTIKSPDNFRVRATTSDLASPPGEWRYPKRLWMDKEHLEIVWSKA
jgi:hypothetical protein